MSSSPSSSTNKKRLSRSLDSLDVILRDLEREKMKMEAKSKEEEDGLEKKAKDEEEGPKWAHHRPSVLELRRRFSNEGEGGTHTGWLKDYKKHSLAWKSVCTIHRAVQKAHAGIRL